MSPPGAVRVAGGDVHASIPGKRWLKRGVASGASRPVGLKGSSPRIGGSRGGAFRLSHGRSALGSYSSSRSARCVRMRASDRASEAG